MNCILDSQKSARLVAESESLRARDSKDQSLRASATRPHSSSGVVYNIHVLMLPDPLRKPNFSPTRWYSPSGAAICAYVYSSYEFYNFIQASSFSVERRYNFGVPFPLALSTVGCGALHRSFKIVAIVAIYHPLAVTICYARRSRSFPPRAPFRPILTRHVASSSSGPLFHLDWCTDLF